MRTCEVWHHYLGLLANDSYILCDLVSVLTMLRQCFIVYSVEQYGDRVKSMTNSGNNYFIETSIFAWCEFRTIWQL
jgi:hypothetical protein